VFGEEDFYLEILLRCTNLLNVWEWCHFRHDVRVSFEIAYVINAELNYI